MSGDLRASEQVIETVADATNSDPVELPPLYDEIDPESLDALLGDVDNGWISFTYAGVEVTAICDERVTIDVDPSPEAE